MSLAKPLTVLCVNVNKSASTLKYPLHGFKVVLRINTKQARSAELKKYSNQIGALPYSKTLASTP